MTIEYLNNLAEELYKVNGGEPVNIIMTVPTSVFVELEEEVQHNAGRKHHSKVLAKNTIELICNTAFGTFNIKKGGK